MAEQPPVVLTIAGFDPSSGAGVTADVKTIAAHACYGVACITAMTVQSTAGVKRVEPTDPVLVAERLDPFRGEVGEGAGAFRVALSFHLPHKPFARISRLRALICSRCSRSHLRVFSRPPL